MHVVLVREGFSAIHVPGITLRDGYQPAIGDVETELSIEPARWFTTLIIDYLTIDCSKRLVKWNMEADMSSLEQSVSNHLKRNSRVLFSEGEFYDYEAKCDELFDTISELFDRQGKTTLIEVSPILLKMLHCHILPNINLNQDDIPKLQDALLKQGLIIRRLEEKIEELVKVVSRHDACLQKHRLNLIQLIQNNPSDIATFDLNILEILREHIKKDCIKQAQELEVYEDAVSKAKMAAAKNLDDKQLAWETQQKRKARDAFMEDQYLRLIHVRETLSEEVIRRQKSMTVPLAGTAKAKSRLRGIHSKKTKSVPKHRGNKRLLLNELYVSTSRMQSDVKEQIKNFVARKVLMTSVKEAISMTVKDLHNLRESGGMEIQRGKSSIFSTDVLNRMTIPPEWLTMEDQVTEMVCDATHAVGVIHHRFCAEMAAVCGAAYQEEEFYRALEETPSDQQSTLFVPPGTTRWFCDSGFNDVDDYMFVCDMDASPTKKATERLKVSIKKHFEEICPIIQTYQPTISINKAWVTYENNFYHVANNYLVPLYESACVECVDTLKTQARNLTVDDLEITEVWLLDMLVARRDSGFESGLERNCHKKLTKAKKRESDKVSDFGRLHRMLAPSIEDAENAAGDSAKEEGNGGGVHIVTTNGSDDLVQEHGAVDLIDSRMNAMMLLDGEMLVPDVAERITNYEELIKQQNMLLISNSDDESASSIGNRESSGSLSSSSSEDQPAEMPHPCPPVVCDSVSSQDSIEHSVQSEKFANIFESALDCLTRVHEEDTPLKKMQFLTRCLRAITTTLASQETNGQLWTPCADELVTVLVVLLLNLAPEKLASLYMDLKFIIDLMAPFLESGVHSYSVVQLEVAFQFLFTKLIKIRNSKTLLAKE